MFGKLGPLAFERAGGESLEVLDPIPPRGDALDGRNGKALSDGCFAVTGGGEGEGFILNRRRVIGIIVIPDAVGFVDLLEG